MDQYGYQKISLLGKGSHGKCYLVKDKFGHLRVSKITDMKHMTPADQMDAVKEGKILEAFSHPYIIKFRDVYRTTKGKL